jgi:tetratricopeptide (TPR) repeat protein
MNKKVFLASLMGIVSAQAIGQDALQDKIKEETCIALDKAITANLKNANDPKKGIKSATWVKLADSYLSMALECGKDSVAAIKAYDTYKKAIEVEAGGKAASSLVAKLSDPKLYSGLMSQGAAFYTAQSYGNAVEMFKLANEVMPNDTTASLYTGIVAQQNQDYATAKTYFERFIANNGKDPAVFYSLAILAKNEKDYDAAIQVLKKGIAASPADKDLKGELINTYIVANKLQDAITDLSKLVDSDPSNILNILNLGLLYDNSGDKEMAMKQYQRVLTIDPNNYDANFSMAVIYFNEAVEIKKAVDAMDMKTYRAEGKQVEAKACESFAKANPFFEKCNQVNPGQDEVVNNLETLKNILAQCGK